MNRLSVGRFSLIAIVSSGLVLRAMAIASSAVAAGQPQTPISSFLPTEPGTVWVYATGDGLKRIESLRSIDVEGRQRVDVEELRGTECLRRFSYESRLDGEQWVRRGPDGEEVVLSPPLLKGSKWRWGQAEVEVLSSSERVEVSGGTFASCVKLGKRVGDRETFLYFAPGVGLVREIVLEEGAERTLIELVDHQVPATVSPERDGTAALRAELELLAARADGAPVRTGGSIPAPRRVSGVDPEKPAFAARAQLKATVVVQILIERDGSIADIEFLRSAPHFDDEVRRALATWKYEPVLVDGKPVRALLTLTFRFD